MAYERNAGGSPVEAATRRPTRSELLERIITAFMENPSETYTPTSYRVEDFTSSRLRKLRITQIGGTALQKTEQVLKDAGEPVTGRNGGLMDILGIDQSQLHHVYCYCRPAELTGEEVVRRLKTLDIKQV